ncbi:MAG: hypothetical protein ACREQA_06985 [Candidatus Binatia bacterium]
MSIQTEYVRAPTTGFRLRFCMVAARIVDRLIGSQLTVSRLSCAQQRNLSTYPVPQNAPHVKAGMKPDPRLSEEWGRHGSRIFRIGVNVLNFPEGQRPKATDVSPWYGVYHH